MDSEEVDNGHIEQRCAVVGEQILEAAAKEPNAREQGDECYREG
jgi:hypothetical protein